MGAPGYLLASTLRAVMGQRLLRRVCRSCRSDHSLDDSEDEWLKSVVGEETAARMRFQKGQGCGHCNRTGYQGRVGIYELLELTPDMRSALRSTDMGRFAELGRQSKSYKPLVASALEFAARGITTLSEAMRIAGEVDQPMATGAIDSSVLVDDAKGSQRSASL
jgi:MSHA biogenesis protein MshE